MEPSVRFELTTCCLQDSCSTPELTRRGSVKPIGHLRHPLDEIASFRNDPAQHSTRIPDAPFAGTFTRSFGTVLRFAHNCRRSFR